MIKENEKHYEIPATVVSSRKNNTICRDGHYL